MALRPKSTSVVFQEFSTSICYMLATLERIHRYRKTPQPADLVITSANDGQHKDGSKHYKNQALDIRSKSFKTERDKAVFMGELAAELGPKFVVIYEYPGDVNEHFHIQLKRDEEFP